MCKDQSNQHWDFINLSSDYKFSYMIMLIDFKKNHVIKLSENDF